MGLFEQFRRGLTKTANILKTDVRDLFKSEGRLVDDGFLDEMRGILFKTDMGYDAVEEIVDESSTKLRGRVVALEEVVTTWKTKLAELLAQESAPHHVDTPSRHRRRDKHVRSNILRAAECRSRLGLHLCHRDRYQWPPCSWW